MKSTVKEAIELETQPVALIWADRAPEESARFKPQTWGCVVSLFAAAAVRGRTGAFDRQTYGCWGGGVGLGFGNQYQAFPGGVECFCSFLSDGNESTEKGRAIGDRLRAGGGARLADDFLKGERYVKNAGLTQAFVDTLPMRDIPAGFVVVKPLDQADPEKDDIKSVTFFVDPDRLSALVILANYDRAGGDAVIIPWAAACQVIGLYGYRELERKCPRGIVGMTDLSARKNVRSTLGEHVMSFTAPWPLFIEMEANVPGSFLQRETWHQLRKK